MNVTERRRTVYELFLELDRLEELCEALEERGLSSVEDVERRIDELNARVDSLEAVENQTA